MSNNLAIMVHFEGDSHDGIYSLYPANEDSEPDFDFRSSFFYCTHESAGNFPENADYNTREEARNAAEAEAARIAWKIGGAWHSNE